MVSTVGARSFSAAAPKLWNSLPAHIRDVGSLCAFKILVQLQQPVVLFNKKQLFFTGFLNFTRVIFIDHIQRALIG